MNDEPTVIRQWRMLRMLGVRRHGIVVSDMAREFGVAARTIRRDLEKLKHWASRSAKPPESAEARSGASLTTRSSLPSHLPSTKPSYCTWLTLPRAPVRHPALGVGP